MVRVAGQSNSLCDAREGARTRWTLRKPIYSLIVVLIILLLLQRHASGGKEIVIELNYQEASREARNILIRKALFHLVSALNPRRQTPILLSHTHTDRSSTLLPSPSPSPAPPLIPFPNPSFLMQNAAYKTINKTTYRMMRKNTPLLKNVGKSMRARRRIHQMTKSPHNLEETQFIKS